MSELNTDVEIFINGEVNFNTAGAVVSKVRLAMMNDPKVIRLRFSTDAVITSAEFLSFLATSAKYLDKKGRRLEISGISGKNRHLIEIARLADFLTDEEKAGNLV